MGERRLHRLSAGGQDTTVPVAQWGGVSDSVISEARFERFVCCRVGVPENFLCAKEECLGLVG